LRFFRFFLWPVLRQQFLDLRDPIGQLLGPRSSLALPAGVGAGRLIGDGENARLRVGGDRGKDERKL